VHVVAASVVPEPGLAGVAAPSSGDELLAASAHIAAGFGQTAALHRVHGAMPAQELLRHADRVNADLIVAGAESHVSGDRVFLGYNAEHLLAHSTRTLALVLLPR
jgi:nucleotide-binding universal stress UspA family protein